jgi:ribosome maturation factor RimP
MRQVATKFRRIIAPVVESMGYELFGIEFSPRGTDVLLRIYIDQPSGISIADCERVSRQVSGLLNVEDVIPTHYVLEVSSPGLDRPLFETEHFVRFRGHRVRVQLVAPCKGRRNLVGCLMGTENDEVVIDSDGEAFSVPLENIKKARLIPEL